METEKKHATIVYRKLKKKSLTGMVVVSLFLLITLLIFLLFNGNLELDPETKLMTKTVLFIVFFGTIPLMFYVVSGKIRKIQEKPGLKDRLRSYARLFIIKFIIYSVLSILALTGFLFTVDPMILLLLLIGIFFLYYERPSLDKIESDLLTDSEISPIQ